VNLAVTPSGPLAPFVSSIGYHRAVLPPGRERVLPSGMTTLMVNLDFDEFRTYGPGGQRVRGAVLEGPSARAVVIDTAEQCHGVEVTFRLAGAVPFFGLVPAGQLVELGELWGTDGVVLRDRLLSAGSPVEALGVVERLLVERLVVDVDPAMDYAVAALSVGALVGDVAERVGMLPKRFVRRFRARVGLTPKLFARVRRLQRVVRTLGPDPVDWAAVAAEHGYCDQSHLIDDFRDLTGITPGAYRPSVAPNHVPVG
jgi:AraC-like DNA-binding protein